METIRAFIAVQFPDEIKSKFAEIQRKLQASGADVRWVKPGKAHVTLQFFGETPLEKIEEIKSALGRVASAHGAFEVSVGGLGVFPNARRPKVVWIGIEKGADQMASLQRSVCEETKRLGLESEEREYSPHITLGRVRSPKNLDRLRSALESEKVFRAGEFCATEVHLIRSILSSEGPSYSTLLSARLLSGSAG